jgi:hypothetical protein
MTDQIADKCRSLDCEQVKKKGRHDCGAKRKSTLPLLLIMAIGLTIPYR